MKPNPEPAAKLRYSFHLFAAPSPTLTRGDFAALALLVASLVAMFWKVLFTPALFFYRDVFNYSYPHAKFIQETLRHASLPYWNPYLNYGEPVLANPNFLFFYPSTLFTILLPIDFAYTLHYVGHFAWAGIGTYFLARRLSQTRAGASFAAFVFAFSGPLLSLGNFYNHAPCAAWIPWALFLTDFATESGSLRSWLCLTLVFSLQFLAAEPFTLLATLLLCLALALHKKGVLSRPWSPRGRTLIGVFLLMGCLMAALCAVQVLPSMDLLQNSRRGTQGLPYKETSTWPFHPLSLLDLVLQDFFGRPFIVPSVWTTVLNGRNLPYLPTVFVGFIPLFFALVGWARTRDKRRNFIAASALSLLVLSFSRLTPVFALAYLLIPPLELVRFPVKLLVPAVMLLAVMAGWGLDALREKDSHPAGRRMRALRPLQGVLFTALVVWVTSWVFPSWVAAFASRVLVKTNGLFLPETGGVLRPQEVEQAANYLVSMLRYYFPGLAGLSLGAIILLWAQEQKYFRTRRVVAAIALLGLGQMVWANYSANPAVPKTFYTYRPPVLDLVDSSALPYRFCSMYRGPFPSGASEDTQSFLNFDSIPEARNLSLVAQVSFRSRLLLERGSMLSSVETSLNVDIERSLPPFVYEFWIFALRQTPDPARIDCLFGRTNVKYMVLAAGVGNASAREMAPIFNGSPQASALYENRCFVPRAFVAGRAHWSPSTFETLSLLSRPDFDVENEVILPGRALNAAEDNGSGAAGNVEIIQRHPNNLTLRAELFRPAYVVLLDRFDPNWHASVDGREVPVLRANQMFRAVRAEAGNHVVRFYYRQRGLLPGAVVSMITFVVVAVLWVRNPGNGLL